MSDKQPIKHQASLLLIASFLALFPFWRLCEIPLALMALLGLALLIRQPNSLRQQPEIIFFSMIFLAFWVPIVISLIGSVNPGKTLTVAAAFLRLYLSGIFVIVTMVHPGAPAKLLRLTAWIVVFWLADSLLQAGTGRNILGNPAAGQINGLFRTGSDLGLVMATMSPLLLVHARRHWPLSLQAGALAAVATVVLMAGGRGGWICLAVVLTGLGAWVIHRDRKTLSHLALAGLLLILAVTGAWHFSQGFASRLDQSLLVLSGKAERIDTALSQRLPIWKTATRIIKAHPVNGVGARNLRYAYKEFADPDDPWKMHGAFHAHTLVLDIGSETGLIGLGGLVLAIWLLLRAWQRADITRRQAMLPYALALLAVFFPLNTHYATYSSAWSSGYFWLLALFSATTAATWNNNSRITVPIINKLKKG